MIGVDIVSVERFKKIVEKHGVLDKENKFLKRIFNFSEIEEIIKRKKPYEGLSARFALKEAVIKAFSKIKKINDYRDIKIKNKKPIEVSVEGFKSRIEISISHEAEYAVAFVVVNI